MSIASTTQANEARVSGQSFATSVASSLASQLAPAALPALILSGIGQTANQPQFVIVNPSSLSGQQLILPSNQASCTSSSEILSTVYRVKLNKNQARSTQEIEVSFLFVYLLYFDGSLFLFLLTPQNPVLPPSLLTSFPFSLPIRDNPRKASKVSGVP